MNTISDAQLKQAIETASPRTACWIALMAVEGFRSIEVAQLRREDVADETVTIRASKTARGRVLPLNPVVAATLEALGEDGPPWNVSREVVSRTVNRHLQSLGIDCTASGLRHWMAKQVYYSASHMRAPDPLIRKLHEYSTAIPEMVQHRNVAIRMARAEGLTLREIAEIVGLSHQAVAKILGEG